MTKSPITLQELRRRIYVKAKAEKSWRFLRQGFGWKRWSRRWMLLFFILNREDFSFVIHLDRQPRTSRRREAQTRSRARSERTLDAVEHSRTLMEWWPFLIFHRGGLRIKVINNSCHRASRSLRLGSLLGKDVATVVTRRRPAPRPVPKLGPLVLPSLSVGEMAGDLLPLRM